MNNDTLNQTLRRLAIGTQGWDTAPQPSAAQIDDLMATLRHLLLAVADDAALKNSLQQAVEQLTQLVQHVGIDAGEAEERALQFAVQLPQLQQLLQSDVEATCERDPAAASRSEVASCYPGIVAMLHYRVAHALSMLGVPLLPRIITERAHSLTGIDIHPSATIGASFAIDHGTGIVIGATARIGHHVMLYQGVTQGAKRFEHDADGRLIDGPRHPVVDDFVTIYSNTSVLGRVHVGHHSVIGGNLWITSDVPPCSQVRQSKPIQHIGFIDGEGI